MWKVTIGALLGVTFLTWAVSLAGLAALQSSCNAGSLGGLLGDTSSTTGLSGGAGAQASNAVRTGGLPNGGSLAFVHGFSGVLPCTKVYRFYWFIVAFELVVLAAAAANLLWIHRTRAMWTGFFAILTMLYFIGCDAFLSAESVPTYSGTTGINNPNPDLNRIRATTAGFIMTAIMNIALMVAIGTDFLAADPTHAHGTGAGVGHKRFGRGAGVPAGTDPAVVV